MPVQTRRVGALAGALVGDALGAPILWMYPSQVRIKHARVLEMLGGGVLGLRPGEITDKSGLACALLESLLAEQDYSLEASVAAQMEWLSSWRGELDPGVHLARSFFEKKVPASQLAERIVQSPGGVAQGASPLCRVLALGLWFTPDQAGPLLTAVDQECRWSQPDGESVGAASMLALLLALFLAGEPLEEGTFRRAEELFLAHGKGGRLLLADPTSWRPNPDQVMPTQPAALASVVLAHLFQSRGFEATLPAVVELGGPSDGAGCLAGALAGAVWGAGAIPERWWKPVREVARARILGTRLAEKGARP